MPSFVAERYPNANYLSTFLVLTVAGTLSLILGLLWNPWFPINKNLWTSTYVIFTGGMALLLLAATYFLVDVKGRAAWLRPCGPW